MAVVADPGGSVVGVWQPNEHRGFLRFGEPGTPGWFDLETRDYARVVEFYRDAIGWTTSVLSDTDEFRYTMLQVGDEQLAGIMDGARTSRRRADLLDGRLLGRGHRRHRGAGPRARRGRAAARPRLPLRSPRDRGGPLGAKFALISGA